MASIFKQIPSVDEDGYFEDMTVVQELEGVELPDHCVDIAAPKDPAHFFYKLNDDRKGWTAEKKPTTAAECVACGVVSHESQTERCGELRNLFQTLAEGSTEYRVKRGEDLSWTVEKIPEKTEAEKLAEAEEQVRAQRDSLIAATDFLMASDYPISDEDRAAVAAYRQALRDVPQQEGFPHEVVWPEAPTVFKNTKNQ